MMRAAAVVIGLAGLLGSAGSSAQGLRPRVALTCLTDLRTVAEIDALDALVRQLKAGQAGKRNAATKAIKGDLRELLELLTARTPDLNLVNGAAAFTARTDEAKKLVRRLVNKGRGGFAKRQTAARNGLAALAAEINTSCDDGIFCNGPETCDVGADDCETGPEPCTAPEVCNEGAERCDPPPAQTFNLTLDQDFLTGGVGNDLFIADLKFNPPTASSLPTLQTGDVLHGDAGSDTLRVTLNLSAEGTITPAVAAIETFEVTDVGAAATTLAGDNITGVDVVNLVDGINPVPLTLSNLGELLNLGISNQDVGARLNFESAATSGAADVFTLTLSDVVTPFLTPGGTVDLTTGTTNGFEQIDIVSNGTSNAFLGITQAVGTTLATVNVSGAAPLVIARNGPLPASVTSIDTTAASGGTDVSVAGALNVTYQGGAGNDIINFAGTYTAADVIDGGGGTNTLGLNASQAVVAASQVNVSNFANLMIVDTLLAQTIDITRFGATDVVCDTTSVSLLLNLPSNITLPPGNRTITMINDDVNDQLNITISGAGTNDTLTYHAANSDQSFAATQIDAIGAETLIVLSTNGPDGTPADGGVNQVLNLDVVPTAGIGTLTVLGDVPLVVLQGITAGVIDASGAGAFFRVETTSANVNAATATITGSPFDDELVGSAGGDTIDGGNGADDLKGQGGADICTGGGGADQFFFDATAQFGDTLVDFTAGTDQVGLGSGIVNFAGIAGTESNPVTLLAANLETGRAAVTALAVGDALKVVRLSSAQTTAQLTGDVGAAIAAYVLAFDSTLQRGVVFHDADWSTAAGRLLVARYENITSLAGVQALTFSDFAEID